jgi:hypothetical protein
MSLRRRSLILVAFATLFAFVSPTLGQLPQPCLDVIYPLGGSAGEDVLLDVGGKDVDGIQRLRFDHPGFKAEATKNVRQWKVTIAAETPPGSYEVRVVTAHGISGARLFAVSRGLAEIKEKEPNDTPETAQDVPINCAVNGRSDNNGDDYFRFLARKGQRITIDCQAFRLDSQLRGQLTLSAGDGKVLAASRPYFDRTDPFLDFIAPADGPYLVRLHDAIFSGGQPYRLIISDHPQIEMVEPMAVAPGTTAKITVFGRNLPGGQMSDLRINDLPLERAEVTAKISADAFGFRGPYHFLSPNLNVRGCQVWPDGWKVPQNPITLAFADEPITVEKEPNNSPEQAQLLTLPTAISGSLDHEGDRDWYRFKAKANDSIAVDLICERIGMSGDLFVIVVDEKGNELTTFDDHGINQRAIAQFNRDPLGTFRVPRDGEYRLLVQDRYRHGGARFRYLLRLAKARPDFFPVVFHETNPDPTSPTVRGGGSAFAEVCLNRRDFTGPVTVEVSGLPKGVTCPPVKVSPQAQFANLIFTASTDAPEWSGPVHVKAWALIDGQKTERDVRPAQRRWRIANINTTVALREFCLAVRPSAAYALDWPEPAITASAGGSVEIPLRLSRHWADFKGKVQITGLNLPPGFTIPTVDIAPDKTDAKVKISVAANVPAGEYSLAVRGDAQVPFAKDAQAKTKQNVRVADPSTSLAVNVMSAKK